MVSELSINLKEKQSMHSIEEKNINMNHSENLCSLFKGRIQCQQLE